MLLHLLRYGKKIQLKPKTTRLTSTKPIIGNERRPTSNTNTVSLDLILVPNFAKCITYYIELTSTCFMVQKFLILFPCYRQRYTYKYLHVYNRNNFQSTVWLRWDVHKSKASKSSSFFFVAIASMPTPYA